MRPERFDRINFLSARVCGILAGMVLVLAFSPAGKARTPENTMPSPESPVYDSESFIQELARLKAGLDAARRSPETLRSYREALPETWTVEAGGRRYAVPTGLIVSRLQKAEKEPEVRRQQVDQTRDYLDALAAETASLSGQPPPREDSARDKLAAILARKEYARSSRQTWWDRLRARIDELLFNALVRFFRRVGGQKSLGTILLWIGVCGAAVVIAYWIFRRWFRTAKMQEIALESEGVPARSWQEWMFAARESAGRGDYRMAIHCAYWAGIAHLQNLGAVSADRSKTPREYLRALTKSKLILPESLSARHQALSMLTTRLEKIWYGYQTATETDFRDSLHQLENLGCHLR
jgi:Domain of unknown function (DUF4129)